MRRFLRRTSLLPVLFLLSLPCAASPAGSVSAEALKSDLVILRNALHAIHPGLFRYNTPQQLDEHFAVLERELGKDSSVADAYLAISRFTAKIQCGHTWPGFANQSKAVADMLFQRDGRVPFHFRWLDGQMVVTRNLSDDPALAAGAVIESIEGVASSKILKTLLPYTRADGTAEGKRRSSLEVQGRGRYEAFDILLPLVFPQMTGTLDLVVRNAAGRRIAVAVPSHTQVQRKELRERESAAKTPDGPPWTLTTQRAGTALLTMPSWAVYNDSFDWQGWLHAQFDTLAAERTKALIIDLRGNEGGSSVGDVILSRLVTKDTMFPQFRRFVRYRDAPAELVPYLDTWDRSFRKWGTNAGEPRADGLRPFVWPGESAEGDIVKAKGPRFEGKVFVLIDPSNSSATFEFAQSARRAGVATLIGETTGGNQRGINGGAFFFLRLPGSGIEVDLPIIGFYPEGTKPDAGIRPDAFAAPSLRSIREGRDPAVELALKMAR